MPSVLEQCLQAHGGLAAWAEYGTLEYDFSRDVGGTEAQDHQLVDLPTRRVRITSDAYTIVDAATDVWIAPDRDALTYGASPRFYSQTYFYFFGIPFVFADPGVNHEDAGQATVRDSTYDVVRITFDSGVGAAPDDVYYAYLDPDTHRLRMVRYSVTYGDREAAEPSSVLVYRDWQKAGGLVVPRRGTYHGWNDGALGEQRGEIMYSNVTFRSERPSDEAFAKPDGGVTVPPPGR